MPKVHPTPPDLPDDVVLRVSGVSKKFCRNLRWSMWYGIQDLAGNLLGLRAEGGNLRAEEGEQTNLSGLKSHPSSLLTKAEGGNLKLEGRDEERADGGKLRAEKGEQTNLSGFIPHPFPRIPHLSPPLQVSSFIPHPSLAVSSLIPSPDAQACAHVSGLAA